ncbi:TPA: hypothetical protein DCQ44_00500 [Candidatus Taylorbacteria bacterium]|nr:hypothetical protein [Candidatus Taylorbacteria bacterium]
MKKTFQKKISGDHFGFTMVETIFYLTFLVILLGIMIAMVVSLSKTYQTIQANKNLESSAVFSLERITREIRNSTSVDVTRSALATSTSGVLTLNTTDSSGAAEIIKFYLATSTGAVLIDVNGSYFGPLTLSGVKATQLQFRLATSTNSQAVKIDLTLKSNFGGASTTKNFYTTAVLRSSY